MSLGARIRAGLLAGLVVMAGTHAGAAQSGPGLPVFVDVTGAAGLDSWQSRYGKPLDKRTILENIGGGAALVDLDGDGRLDVYLPSGQSAWESRDHRNAWFRGAPEGRFVAAPIQSGALLSGWYFGVTAADYDDDGYRDLYVTEHGRNALLRNNGDGSFENVTERTGAGFDGFGTGAAFADYDRDGVLDLVVNNYVDVDPTTVPEPGSGPYCRWKGVAVPCGPRGLPGERSLLLHGDGHGRFQAAQDEAFAATDYYGLGAVWADGDGDGWVDLYLADDQTPNRLFLNHGGTLEETGLLSGTAFSEDGHAQAGMGTDWAEIDGDALADLVVTNFADETNALYRALAPGLFVDDTVHAGLAISSFRHVGWGVGFRDLDNDGDLDLFVANGHVYSQVDTEDLVDTYPQPDQLFLREDDRYREWRPGADDALATAAVSRGAAFGDVDRDGRVDILVGVLDGAPRLLMNRTPGGRFLQVRLVGRDGNRDAVGARVIVKAPGMAPMRRDVQAGHSYLSQSEYTLHFGLAGTGDADVSVHWPSGPVRAPTVIEDVPANSLLVLHESGRYSIIPRDSREHR